MKDNEKKDNYLSAVSLIEKLHRLFLETVKCELDELRVKDINNVQAMVLYNLGKDEITVGELTSKGCYLGSNVSYNLKKMIQAGYIDHSSSAHDKRSSIIKLTPKGLAFRKHLDAAFDKQVELLTEESFEDAPQVFALLKRLGVFWTHMSRRLTGFDFRK